MSALDACYHAQAKNCTFDFFDSGNRQFGLTGGKSCFLRFVLPLAWTSADIFHWFYENYSQWMQSIKISKCLHYKTNLRCDFRWARVLSYLLLASAVFHVCLCTLIPTKLRCQNGGRFDRRTHSAQMSSFNVITTAPNIYIFVSCEFIYSLFVPTNFGQNETIELKIKT